MKSPPFTMSKYASELHLLRDKCAWQERELERLRAALEKINAFQAFSPGSQEGKDLRCSMIARAALRSRCISCGAEAIDPHVPGCPKENPAQGRGGDSPRIA